LRWLFFGAGCVEPAIVDKMLHRPTVERKGALGYGSYEDTVNTLEEVLWPGPWILGQRFSAADLSVGALVQWGSMVKALEPRPKVGRYMERIAARPALQKTLKGA
jgi:glutathione S-transferase